MARRKSNPGNEMGMIILLGGGAAAVWYLMNYGPNGAVPGAFSLSTLPTDPAAVSYWNTWFGATAPTTSTSNSSTPAAPVTTAPVTTVAAPAPVNTIQNPTVPTPVVVAPTPTPVMTAPVQVISAIPTPVVVSTPVASAPATATGLSVPPGLIIPSTLVVSPNINNSLSGYVSWNGNNTNLTIIPTQASAGVGLIWNTNGQDITSQFNSAQQAALVSAFQSAPQNATAGLGVIMQLSPFISPATNGVRDPASLGLAGLASLGRISRRKGWGSLNLGSVPTGRYLQ